MIKIGSAKPIKASSLRAGRKIVELPQKVSRKLIKLCFGDHELSLETRTQFLTEIGLILGDYELAEIEYDKKPIHPLNRLAALRRMKKYLLFLTEIDPYTIGDLKEAGLEESTFYQFLRNASPAVDKAVENLSAKNINKIRAPSRRGYLTIAELLLLKFSGHNTPDSPQIKERGIEFVRLALENIEKIKVSKKGVPKSLGQYIFLDKEWGGLRVKVRPRTNN